MKKPLHFHALPNEVLFLVFSYLKIGDLLKCGQVSKRFRAISNNLWPEKINLCYKKVPVGFLVKLLYSECKYLSLSESILEDTLNLPKVPKLDRASKVLCASKYLSLALNYMPEDSQSLGLSESILEDTLNMRKASKLKYLNLSGFGIKCNQLQNSEELLESCYSLQKLSLSKCHLSYKLIDSISLQNGKTLKVLDLSRCTLCTKRYKCMTSVICKDTISIWQIVKQCTELKELSLHRTDLTEKSIVALVSNLTSKIEKLDLFDMDYLNDDHVKTLVTRCNKITELNLGGKTSLTKQSLSVIIEHLKLTLVKLNFKFTTVRFDLSDLYQLKTMKKLKLLCYDNKEARKIINHRRMKKMMPNLQINSGSGSSRIAGPCQPEYNHRNWVIKAEGEEKGFWEINAEKEKLFTDYFSSRYLQIQYSKE